MDTVIGHEPLFKTNLKYFKAKQIINGRLIFDKYENAKNSIIQKNISGEYINFLAYPVKKDNDDIEFHGIKSSSDDAPTLFGELSGDDKDKYRNIKEKTIAHYQTTIDRLKGNGKATDAEFLADAIKYVDDDFLYCYDNRVVLGLWGMQKREDIREDIDVIRKDIRLKRPRTPIMPPVPEDHDGTTPIAPPDPDGGDPKPHIPPIPPTPPIPPIPVKFWDRVKIWFSDFCLWWRKSGCLKWLLILLLLALLLPLLLRNCSGCSPVLQGGGALSGNDSSWLSEDNNHRTDGGIYDPYHPYNPVPTPPGYEGILPPYQGVLPPNDGSDEILPGNPDIIANKLNILMENEDKSILDLAKDFKAKYPEEAYKIVYYDDVVKRMQIEIPKEKRQQLKDEIPEAFAPEYELFVFDEALFEGSSIPSDPGFSDPAKTWYLKTIKAFEGWEITTGDPDITVAIVDNGFNIKHPELAGKVLQPYNVWLHSDKVFPQEIDHGTHVAGIAIGLADNGKGLCGIAPKCGFMPVQVADDKGRMTITSVLDGIIYALYQGADVINVSLGAQFSEIGQIPESEQQDLIDNYFKEEERLWREIMRIAANHNSTIVIAAGNDNILAGIDAIQRPELFITVSATDKDNHSLDKASFSNYGQYTTVSAPGCDIYSSIGRKDYKALSGTSMAAPIVAGAVALMKSLDKGITSKRIINILRASGLQTQGNIAPLIQLDKALNMVKNGEDVESEPTPSTGDVQILLSWNNYNDLDLICTDPDGNAIWYKNKTVPSGGHLDVDMNAEYPDSQHPIENIYWKTGGAPSGTYNVYILYYKKHISDSDTPYTVTVKHGSETEQYEGTMTEEKKSVHICSFTIGESSSEVASSRSAPQTELQRLEQERNRLETELERINSEIKRIITVR